MTSSDQVVDAPGSALSASSSLLQHVGQKVPVHALTTAAEKFIVIDLALGRQDTASHSGVI